MLKKLKIAILGFGSRGVIYSLFVKNNPNMYEFAAVIDSMPTKLHKAVNEFDIDRKVCFSSYQEFIKANVPCDMVAICTQDDSHCEHAIACLRAGFDLLLEKPISNNLDSCIKIIKTASELNRKVVIAHVLRYTPFYREVKRIIDSGEIGDVVTMLQTENVGYWHQAHSFVRGEWGNKEDSSPMILAKCCHDIDIIKWLMGEKCTDVSSFGSLYYFKSDNKPENSAERCIDCKLRGECIYDAVEFYNRMPGWAATFVCNYSDLDDALRRSKFGRCVYSCNNNVVDHQIVNMQFLKGKTAQLTMTAFSDECYRSLKLFGTKGELVGNVDKRYIDVKPYRQEGRRIDVNTLATDFSVHQGGDNQMMRDIHTYFTTDVMPLNMTSAENSLESHLIAFAAEESRLKGGNPQKL